MASHAINVLQTHGTAAIIGPHGTGKSSLVHTLLPHLQQAFPIVTRLQLSSATDAMTELSHWQRSVATSLASGGCWVIDGFEQLPWLVRRRLVAQARRWRPPLARSRHSGQAKRPCLLLTAHRRQLGVKTVLQTDWDNAVVGVLTREKLAGLPPQLRERMLGAARCQAAIMARHRNVRDYWFTLYDEFERLRAEGCVSSSVPDSVRSR